MIRQTMLAIAFAAGVIGLQLTTASAQNAPAIGTPADAASAAGGLKIAVCNPARIFQDMQETQDLKKAMEAESKTYMEQNRDWERRVKDLEASRNQLKSDSPQYAEKSQELLKTATEYEVWGKVTQMDVQRRQKQRIKDLFDKIQAAVAEVAEQKGIDLVIAEQRRDVPENLDAINVDQLQAILSGRNILFFKPQIDISNDVIAVLDTKYRAGQ